MKHLNDIIQEGLLDDISDNDMDKKVIQQQIYNELMEYELFKYQSEFKPENIDLDKKGRVIFVGLDHLKLDFNYSSYWPDSISDRGLGDFDGDIYFHRVRGSRVNLSKLKLMGKYDHIYFNECKFHIDELPRANQIYFGECSLINPHIKPKKKPKNLLLKFDILTLTLVSQNLLEYAYGIYPNNSHGNFELKL
jgi:hypothetical protein